MTSPDNLNFSIRVGNLKHSYGTNPILNDISFGLEKGESLGLIGPDGVGKSTLLGILSGTRKIQDGSVEVLRLDVRDFVQRETVKTRVAYMRQGLGVGLYHNLTVDENIRFVSHLFSVTEREMKVRSDYLLDATGLAPFRTRPAGKLSGGMKQKLQLCCCLMRSPDLLILDEPTTGVDPLSRLQFWDLLDSIRSNVPAMTLVVATAYMEEATRFDQLLVMGPGKILISGSYQEILKTTEALTLEDAYVKLLSGKRIQKTKPHREMFKSSEFEPVIEAKSLCKNFGNFIAVDNVDLEVNRGEIFGFLGPNGCGKSTTMRMLTGLLLPSSGQMKLFGKEISAIDKTARLSVGYMSQSFSLYQELTVKENLELHAVVYRIQRHEIKRLVENLIEEFELTSFSDQLPINLPLGIRQRLQLAVACLHSPEMLILDEPTSGVDPEAREKFWDILIKLSHHKKVTVFVSTHFMDEASKCNRVSLMNNGRLLAVGSPNVLIESCQATTLDEAFMFFLEQDQKETRKIDYSKSSEIRYGTLGDEIKYSSTYRSLARMLAFAIRENTEFARDKTRRIFAVFGPPLLLLVAAYSVSFDIGSIRYAVIDHDQSELSRELLSNFTPPHFKLENTVSPDKEMSKGRIELVIDIPNGFGREVNRGGHRPEIGVFIDGSKPLIAEKIKGYTLGVIGRFLDSASKERAIETGPEDTISIPYRYAYNQQFRSIVSVVPGFLMVTLTLFPTMMAALSIVKEKESGSIQNFYSSPATAFELLIGKILPYMLWSAISFLFLFATALLIGVPLKGSFGALAVGSLAFIFAMNALGLLFSALVTSQVAAVSGSAIFSLILSMKYSGLLYPTSTLTGIDRLISIGTPPAWFQGVSIGTFTKGLGATSLVTNYFVLLGFGFLYLFIAAALLRKQED